PRGDRGRQVVTPGQVQLRSSQLHGVVEGVPREIGARVLRDEAEHRMSDGVAGSWLDETSWTREMIRACPASTTGRTHSSNTLGLNSLGWRTGFAVSQRRYSSSTNRFAVLGNGDAQRP